MEVFCYVFHFAGVICGPLCFYSDYVDYVTGDNYKRLRDSEMVKRHKTL